MQQCKQNPLPQKHASGGVRDGNACAVGRVGFAAGDTHQAAHALHDLIHTRAISIRAGLAKAGDAGVNQTGIGGFERLVVDLQSMLHI